MVPGDAPESPAEADLCVHSRSLPVGQLAQIGPGAPAERRSCVVRSLELGIPPSGLG